MKKTENGSGPIINMYHVLEKSLLHLPDEWNMIL